MANEKALFIKYIKTNPYLLFRPREKINEGKRTTEKPKGTLDFHHLGPHRIYNTNRFNDRLGGIYGVFYGLNKTRTFRRTGSKAKSSKKYQNSKKDS